jgi:uncharacterized membrane protein SpoIIM required for sporulation
MVLELLINPWKAESNPWELFFIGAAYSSIAILLSNYIFAENISIVMVFLTTLACTYLIQKVLKVEEEKDDTLTTEISRLKQHTRALSVFMFLFLGFVAAFTLWYVVLPADTTHNIFSLQEKTINCINSATITGCITGGEAFSRILMNNIKVLVFTLLFALFYGAGAVFILAWNAAIVGTAIGIFIRNSIGTVAGNIGLSGAASYFGIFSAGILRYMTHGTLEILAYFMAALAGGIISVGITKHDFNSPEFRKIMIDSVDIVALAFGVLLLAAVVEVFITPAIF